MKRALVLALVVAGVLAGSAGGAGPSPGVAFGSPGVVSHDGKVRYVALRAGRGTLVEAISTRDGIVGHTRYLKGFDRRERDEKMTGLPLTRVGSDDASWAYTFYSRDSGGPFVHALHTTAREAFCIDLPLKVPDEQLGHVRMRVSVGKLTIRLRGKTLATVDTRTFEVTH